ncbi:MAG: 8-oxoguanine DNA glycosylase [Verrucomicrobia bacterium]|nr:8-oxoguanine DNA glycosylase [Verrucomicrobiota bacterium]
MPLALRKTIFAVREYDLAATLTSGQAFRWTPRAGAWEGVIGSRWVRLRQVEGGIQAETPLVDAADPDDWRWLTRYLQTEVDLEHVLASFPDDEPMRAAVAACRGLRLLRQEPWECLASFILSSTKQIVQIQQIVSALCARYGEPMAVPLGPAPAYAFPSAARLAACAETELRECKMGFRAPHLLQAARRVADGEVDLKELREWSADDARRELLRLRGVGPKIADCVLLFAYGFQSAFPVDVWVRKALVRLYFSKRRPTPRRLHEFATTHFGPHAGYAQQYLFHYIRQAARPWASA